MKTNLALLFALTLSSAAQAGTTDILNPPSMPTKGWELVNGGNMGQSFNAAASDVTLGIYIADQETYTQQANQAWLASCTTACTVSPWNVNNVVSPSISLKVTVYEGEGLGGKVIYQSPTPIILDKPFNGLASVDLGAAGVFLTVGQQYTVIYTETSGNSHTYWQLFSTIDTTPTINPTTNQIDPNANHGAYYGGWAYIDSVQQNPDNNIGDIAFQVIDNTPPVSNIPVACQGTSAIVSSTNVSKLFMTLANGDKVAYSNVYGSKGTTTFTYNRDIAAGTFPVGSIVTYVGTLNASTICLPSALTIDPAPVVVPPTPTCTSTQVLQGNQCVDSAVVPPSCTVPAVLDATTNSCVTPPVTPTHACTIPTDAKKVEGEAKITAVGTNSITVGNQVIFFDDCTVSEMDDGAKSFAIGQRVEYKGFSSSIGITARKLKLDNHH